MFCIGSIGRASLKVERPQAALSTQSPTLTKHPAPGRLDLCGAAWTLKI
jgi:hypothetical protein